MTERSDWKVTATLDRDALSDDIAKLVGIMKRQRIYCIVFALDAEEAMERASDHLLSMSGISPRYVKALHPRRMPT